MSELEQQREAERYQEWCAERDANEEQQYHIYLEDRITELEDGLREIKRIAKCRPVDREILKTVNAPLGKESEDDTD